MIRYLSRNLPIYYYYTFAFVFSWLFLGILFDNQIYKFNTLPVVIYLFAWIFVTSCIFKVLNHTENFLIRWEKPLLTASLLALFLIQLFFGYQLAIETAWDTEAVYKGAVSLATTGNLGGYSDYFHIFPHNLGSTTILSLLFSVSNVMGISDYYLIGTVYNVLSIVMGIFFVYLICRELRGLKVAFLSLWLCASCITLYFYTPVIYTDTLSFPFVPFLYYLYLRLLKQTTFKKRLISSAVFGLFCALGALIKFTVVIVAVAILIDIILRRKTKDNWYAIIIAIIVFTSTTTAFDIYRYGSVLDKDVSDQKRVPYTHWMMMGLTGDGAYNGADYEYTYTYTTQEQRVEANLIRIQERLNNYGVQGYLEFINRKQQLNFGSGIYGVNEIIDDNPIRPNILHNFGLDTGKHFETFKNSAQGYHIFIFMLIILSALHDAASKTPRAINILAARLAIAGIYLFLMLWEGNSRYIINFIPIFIIAAAFGFPDIYKILAAIKHALTDALRHSETSNNTGA